ncbi:MAG TPA: EthD domain-containing protein [Solirubrobacteraceae bacterium]|jgi:hypothetical protein
MHHKIFLVPFAEGWSVTDGNRVWQEEHAPIWLKSPGLRGYIQNRPIPEWWERMPAVACAEDWFDSREDEAALHETAYYREIVRPDEERMFKRENAWVSTVSSVEVVRDGEMGPFRVLSFGGGPPSEAALLSEERVEYLHLRRSPPLCTSPVIVSAWASTIELARELSRRLGGFSIVAKPAVLLAPPVSPWTETGRPALG